MKNKQSLLKSIPTLIASVIFSMSLSANNETPNSFVEVVGDAAFKMQHIPGGTLTHDDGTTEKVAPFYMAETETTQSIFQTFIHATGYENSNRKGCYEVQLGATEFNEALTPANASKANEPVVCVTWQDVQAFISWLNTRSSRNDMFKGEYRLPTEAEWTIAAKGKNQSEYPPLDGNKICLMANIADQRVNHSRVGEFNSASVFKDYLRCVDGAKYLNDVGQYRANYFGLKDLIGNVWEMTSPKHKERYLAGSSEYLSSQWMIVKGGSFSAGRTRLSAEYRVPLSKTEARNEVGFRLVFAPMATAQNSGSYQPSKV